MERRTKRIAGAAAGGLLLLGGGAALASEGVFDPQETSREIIDGAAQDLGVSSDELRDALRASAVERVDAALEAGEISEEEATRLKEQISSGDFPLIGGFGHPGGPWGHGPGGTEIFGAAADYLDLTDDQIRMRLMNGRTLAEIAESEGRSVDGLIEAFVEAQKASLEEAVDDERITEAQRDDLLDGLQDRITDLVENGMGPRRGGMGHHGPGPGGRGW